jgi:hypothetical protein
MKCHSNNLSQLSECSVDILCGSECHVVSSWLDVTSRRPEMVQITLLFWVGDADGYCNYQIC